MLSLAAFHGLARENMTRAQAWRFIDMGLRIERAIYLGTLLDSTLRAPEAENPSLLEAVLEVADSSITYRSRNVLQPLHRRRLLDDVADDDAQRGPLFRQAVEKGLGLRTMRAAFAHEDLELGLCGFDACGCRSRCRGRRGVGRRSGAQP